MTGKVFGKLTVLRHDPSVQSADKHSYWLCRCECGNELSVNGRNLRRGMTRSCGCLRTHHGQARRGFITPEAQVYYAAKARCTNPNDKAFKDYGGRGIKFLFTSIDHFLAVLGQRPEGKTASGKVAAYTLGRFGDEGNYEPGNVKWMTWSEQIANRRKRKTLSGFSTEELKYELQRRGELSWQTKTA